MPEPILEARSLTKAFGNSVVVDAVDVRVYRQECWGLLGPNGAGKTTFLRMAIGNTPQTAGELRVMDYPIPARATAMRQRIGVVPQKDNLDPDFTVIENLHTYGAYFGLRGTALDQRISRLLAFASLEAKANAPIATLSGGMQRRLSLVRALINDPELLVLDEPTTGLDPQARQLIWQRLRQLKTEGLTLILTTHYMEEAARLCDRITFMDHGHVLDTDRPTALIGKYVEPQVVEVFGPGLEQLHAQTAAKLADRTERVGETIFYYCQDERPLLGAIRQAPGLSFLHRPANLEDVFLRLTGHDLRDA
jgi:lipooligosaccharide transport system ATP-binding protein